MLIVDRKIDFIWLWRSLYDGKWEVIRIQSESKIRGMSFRGSDYFRFLLGSFDIKVININL